MPGESVLGLPGDSCHRTIEMIRSVSLICLLAWPGTSFALEQPGRLIGQRVEGLNRLCLYEPPRTPIRPITAQEPRALRVGTGEPCPSRFRPQRVQEQSERNAGANEAPPVMAMLVGQERSANGKICYYAYLGQRYSRTVPISATCPLTPHFSY